MTEPTDRAPKTGDGRERLQRALARAGVASRRASEELIEDGRVSINGALATLGDKVDPSRDRVYVDGHLVPLDPALHTFAFHKPAGVVTTVRDPQGRPDLTGYLPAEVPGVVPVGRLDRNSEGLLLLTNDGELANRVMHPRYGVEKEYLAEVEGRPTRSHVAKLQRGVELDDGPARAVRATVRAESAGRGAVEVVMGEGRKREVRRLLAAVGLPVVRLVRVRVGPVRLGQLPPGELRELEPSEVRELYAAAGA
jgi:23S rRNA pseudouridine2605 synthase